jgi:hypothetical protein
MNEINLNRLKIKLQGLGILQPAAWKQIVSCLNFTHLNKGESFSRTCGNLAWLSSGILKEYNPNFRKKPAIINFLVSNDSVISRKINTRYYLKACVESELYHLNIEELTKLGLRYPELKAIYVSLCAQYDEGQEFKTLILEEKLAQQRIALLIGRYKPQLNFISKKDLSNYVHLNYDHFCTIYAKQL